MVHTLFPLAIKLKNKSGLKLLAQILAETLRPQWGSAVTNVFSALVAAVSQLAAVDRGGRTSPELPPTEAPQSSVALGPLPGAGSQTCALGGWWLWSLPAQCGGCWPQLVTAPGGSGGPAWLSSPHSSGVSLCSGTQLNPSPDRMGRMSPNQGPFSWCAVSQSDTQG